jgi:nitrogen fixation protein
MDVAGVGILALIVYAWRKDLEEYIVRVGRRILDKNFNPDENDEEN